MGYRLEFYVDLDDEDVRHYLDWSGAGDQNIPDTYIANSIIDTVDNSLPINFRLLDIQKN